MIIFNVFSPYSQPNDQSSNESAQKQPQEASPVPSSAIYHQDQFLLQEAPATLDRSPEPSSNLSFNKKTNNNNNSWTPLTEAT